MERLPITDSVNRSTESMILSVASRSTESLKIDLRLQSDHSRESVLQDRTLEEQFESCVSLCKKEIEEALAAAKISTYAKTCFHPIARQIDDELIRLEIWALDFGTKDGSWEELSKLVTKNDTVGRHLRKIFDDLNASLEKIGREMKLIQSFVEDAARSTEISDNDHWTTRVDVAVSQTNETVNTLSSTVRTFISQRNLTSLKEAIENGKNPYDGLRHESDDTIDSLHKKRQEVSETNKNEQNEQNIKLQKGPHKGPQWKAEDTVYPSPGRASSREDTLVAPLWLTSRDKERGEDKSWNSHNLLSLDGGGIRGYWTLLVLQELMGNVAIEEERIDREEQDEPIDREPVGMVHHSFWPERWPKNVTQVPPTKAQIEVEKQGFIYNKEAQFRAMPAVQRYLPCHYFDYICGSSTGALIAIMLGRLRMTVLDCIIEYEKLGEKVFGRPRHFITLNLWFIDRTKYNAKDLTKVFQDVTKRRSEQRSKNQRRITFRSKRVLCKTFVTSLKIESHQWASETLYLIRSYDHIQRTHSGLPRRLTSRPTMHSSRSNTGKSNNDGEPNFGEADDFEIWEVARAATAAPFYFDPLKIDIPGSKNHQSFIDAGFSWHNNPTKDGIREMYRMNPTKSIGIVVSVGTARKDESNLKTGIFAFRSKMLDLAKKATDTEMVHGDMQTESEKPNSFQYYRLNDDREGLDMQLDEWEPKPGRLNRNDSGSATLTKIRDAFNGWVSHRHVDFEDCAKALVRCRRARMVNRAKWERYATGAEYTCLQGCHRENFDDREQFKEHLRTAHGFKPQDLEAEVNECRRDWQYQPAPS